LLIVFVVEVSSTKISVCLHKDEEVTSVNVDKDLKIKLGQRDLLCRWPVVEF